MLCTDNVTMQTHKDALVKELKEVAKEWRNPLLPWLTSWFDSFCLTASAFMFPFISLFLYIYTQYSQLNWYICCTVHTLCWNGGVDLVVEVRGAQTHCLLWFH